MAKKQSGDYINNARLYDAIVKWHESGKEKLSDELGICIMLLAKKIVNHRNFNRYPDSVKEEMVEESIISLIKAIPKFDYKNYNNPFSYLTSCAFNVNLSVITKHYRDRAKEIRYFLENTETIDLTDGSTLVHIDQERQYRESAHRKKEQAKERRPAKTETQGPSLF